MTEAQERLVQEIRDIVIETRTKLGAITLQTERNTSKIDQIEGQHLTFVTKDECRDHRQAAGEEKKLNENRNQNQLGRRQSDRIALRAFVVVVVSFIASMIFSVLNFIFK